MNTPTLGEQLAAANTKLDILLVRGDDHEIRLRNLEARDAAGDTIEEKADRENRLRSLERFRWVLLGVAAASPFAGTFISQLAK